MVVYVTHDCVTRVSRCEQRHLRTFVRGRAGFVWSFSAVFRHLANWRQQLTRAHTHAQVQFNCVLMWNGSYWNRTETTRICWEKLWWIDVIVDVHVFFCVFVCACICRWFMELICAERERRTDITKQHDWWFDTNYLTRTTHLNPNPWTFRWHHYKEVEGALIWQKTPRYRRWDITSFCSAVA